MRADIAKSAALGEPVARELLAQEGRHHLGQAFGGLEGDVADEAVADDHIDGALVDVIPFHVAVEVEAAVAEQLAGLLDDLVALDVLFADVEQPNVLGSVGSRRPPASPP